MSQYCIFTVKCDVEIFIVYTVFTFNRLTLMFRHGCMILQIKNLLIAGAVEITCVFYDGNMLIKKMF